MSLTIFLSHAWQDKDLATFKAIENKLRGDGYKVWVDKREIEFGEKITPKLDEAIAESDLVLSLWSEHASDSEACLHEIAVALREDKLLAPCRLDNHDPAEHPDLKDRKYFDFRGSPHLALLHLSQFLLRLRNRDSAVLQEHGSLQKQITALNDLLAEVEDSDYRRRMGMSGNQASSTYVQSMLEKGKMLLESSDTPPEEKARMLEFMCRLEEIAAGHPGPEDDTLKKQKMFEAIDKVDPQGESTMLQTLKHAMGIFAKPTAKHPDIGQPPGTSTTGGFTAMNDPLRNHIATVRRHPHAGMALRQRLGQVLGTPNHPQIDQYEQTLNSAIDVIPLIIEQVTMAAQQAGITHLLAPMLQQVTYYFLNNDDLIPDSQGTLGLLDDAYLAHAFLYQVNIAYQTNTGFLLLAFDPSPTIQVLRTVLGPQITTQLDQVVVQGVNQAIQQSYYEQLTQQNQTLPASGGPGSWGSSYEDEMSRMGAEMGISFN